MLDAYIIERIRRERESERARREMERIPLHIEIPAPPGPPPQKPARPAVDPERGSVTIDFSV